MIIAPKPHVTCYVPVNLCGGCGATYDLRSEAPGGWVRGAGKVRCAACGAKEMPAPPLSLGAFACDRCGTTRDMISRIGTLGVSPVENLCLACMMKRFEGEAKDCAANAARREELDRLFADVDARLKAGSDARASARLLLVVAIMGWGALAASWATWLGNWIWRFSQ